MEQTICIFGDSIVWGSWDPEEGGWVSRLRSYLETSDYEIRVYNCGVSGDNTDNLLQRFDVEATAREPSIVIFAIGINDSQYANSKNNSRVPIERFQYNLQKLINKAKKFTQKIIFLSLTKVDESKTMPVPWDTTKYYDEENVKKYNSKIKDICNKNNLPFIDIFDLLDNSDLEDGLHPNQEGHKKIFLKIKDFLQGYMS
ncbi:hypothetical protein J4440_05675 [Candidatus Woesearchaeota archaeon]|nr:hypothetical protein [Candidatus Woesearchaeota archaeon]